MSTEKWIAGSGVGFTWTAAFGAEVTTTALASGNAVLSSVIIDNTTALDVFMDVSISLASITPTGTPYIGLYLYPLNQDTTTYGDGKFGSAAAGPPASQYWAGNIPAVASAGVQIGMLRDIVLPPWKFKLVFYNVLGVAIAASGNVVKYTTHNRAVA